jgi:hypothetical protein
MPLACRSHCAPPIIPPSAPHHLHPGGGPTYKHCGVLTYSPTMGPPPELSALTATRAEYNPMIGLCTRALTATHADADAQRPSEALVGRTTTRLDSLEARSALLWPGGRQRHERAPLAVEEN